jgi:hypothetical protein
MLTIVKNGNSDFRIVVAKDADEAAIYAAEEFSNFLKQISGAQLPIVTDASPKIGPEVLVGQSARVKLPAGTNLGKEAFVSRASADGLLLVGGGARGTLYAVYDFFEAQLGCRWFTPEISRIPKRDTVEIPFYEKTDAPAFEYRRHSMTPGADKGRAEWFARSRVNATYSLEKKHGGRIDFAKYFVHTFYHLFPKDEYFAEHPEYYSEIDGKRIFRTQDEGGTQLCLTNPDVLRITIEKVKGWLRENPEASIASVSQNDVFNYCTCAKCAAVDKEEGSPMGSLLRFVNAVAEGIEGEFPEASVETLAYWYTRTTPKITRPRHNVIIRLCTIECCFIHPLGTCISSRDMITEQHEDREDFTILKDFTEWSKICDRIYVWDYTVNYGNYLLPFPNTNVLADNMRFFAKHNVKGVFEEGSSEVGSYCAELNAYIMTKLLWNPEADWTIARDEFLNAVYKEAAPVMGRIFEAYYDAVVREDLHMHLWIRPRDYFTDPAAIRAISGLFDEAEKAAVDEGTLREVKKARLWQRRLELGKLPRSPEKDELLDAFAADCEAFGVGRLRETQGTIAEVVAMEKSTNTAEMRSIFE